MATYNSDRAGTGNSAKTMLGVNAVIATATFTAAPALNDVANMVKIPAGATVLDMILVSDDLDTGGTPAITLDVGDSGSANRYFNGSTIAQGGGMERLALSGGVGHKYTSDDTIKITVSAAPASGATGSVKLMVVYSMDA